jgi:hypothetical protein
MRLIAIALLSVFFFYSCVTMPSGAVREFASGGAQHRFAVKRAMILGEGVSPEMAERASRDAGTTVLYSLSRGQKSATFLRDVKESLRAMAASGDAWEVAVAERARQQLATVLAGMKANELIAFRGKLILSAASRADEAFLFQIKRVFGDGVAVEYIGPEGV